MITLEYDWSFLSAGDSDDELDSFGEEPLYSIHEGSKATRKPVIPRKAYTNQQCGQSKASVFIGIKRGRVTLVHPTLVSLIVRQANGW